METNKETVEQVCEMPIDSANRKAQEAGVRLSDQSGCEYYHNAKLLRELKRRREYDAAHKRELAAKDAEIARLKACRDGNCERIRLGAEPCEGCHVQVANDEITKLRAKRNELYDCNLKLRALVNELEDALNDATAMACKGEYCNKQSFCPDCQATKNRALVAKAREVVNG